MSEPICPRCDVALALPPGSLHERASAALRDAGHAVRTLPAPVAPADLRAGEVLVLGTPRAAAERPTALQALAAAAPAVAIVALLEGEAPAPAVRRALRAGARGVVVESDLERALAATVQVVAAGHVVMPRAAERTLTRPALSVRERQVLSLVVLGLMNGEIATQLFVAESTVKSHLSSAFAKLGVRSRSEAVELILDPDQDAGLGILRIGGEPLAAVAEAS
jgi:DNA-binding NarL/FixJ family response regulator